MLTAFLVLAFAASMAGGYAPTVEGFLAAVGLERLVSFRSGLLVAVALSEVLPEAWGQSRPACAAAAAAALALGWVLHHGHGEEHEGHELTHPHVHHHPAHRAATVAAMFGHSLTDGVNLGATAVVGGPAVLAVGAATALHKVADGFTVTSLFHQTGHPRGAVLAILVGVSLATPLGALLGRAGALGLGPATTASLLGFAGGSFLYVGATQIVPHLARRRDVECAGAFAAGAVLMLILRRFAA